MLLAFRILEAGDLLNDDESPASFGLADLMKEALLHEGFVNVPQMTSCMDEWITERHSIVRAVLPPAPDTQHNGKRSAPVLSPSPAKRLRRSKAPASAKRPTPKLAERKADWHPPLRGLQRVPKGSVTAAWWRKHEPLIGSCSQVGRTTRKPLIGSGASTVQP